MKLFPLAVIVITLSGQCANAWESAPKAEGALAQFVASLKTRKTAVFIASCQVSHSIKAVVIFRPEAAIGDFFVITDKTASGNAAAGGMGQVSFQDGAATVLRTNASPDAREAYEHLARNLLSSPFRILPETRLNEIFSEPTQQIC
jgi:hypothetical protein